MSSETKNETRDDGLNDSWVELHFQNQGIRTPEVAGSIVQGVPGSPPHGIHVVKPLAFHSGAMEKLLLEAQKEGSTRSNSRNESNASSRGSPKSPPHSPNTEWTGIPPVREGQVVAAVQGTDWIWDWSSRPEAHPPSNLGSIYKHPIKKHKLSVRNTRVMRSPLFSLENLPTLLFTHACTFLMGAAVMFIYLKKYCRWAVIATPAIMD